MEKTSKKYEIRVTGMNSELPSVAITDSQSAVDFARRFYRDDILLYESAFIMLLNRCNRITGWAKISQGGTCSTVVDIKVICKYAIDTLASGVILVHNHPSGNAKPSAEDIKTAKDLGDALRLFDISLLDSIIITDGDGSYSFADEGEIR